MKRNRGKAGHRFLNQKNWQKTIKYSAPYKSLYKSYFSYYSGDSCRGDQPQKPPSEFPSKYSFPETSSSRHFFQNISSRAVARVFKTANVFSRYHFFIASFAQSKTMCQSTCPSRRPFLQYPQNSENWCLFLGVLPKVSAKSSTEGGAYKSWYILFWASNGSCVHKSALRPHANMAIIQAMRERPPSRIQYWLSCATPVFELWLLLRINEGFAQTRTFFKRGSGP